MATLKSTRNIPGAKVEVLKNISTPNAIHQLNLAFKNIKDYTFLPNYKNAVKLRFT